LTALLSMKLKHIFINLTAVALRCYVIEGRMLNNLRCAKLV
jgi:hypothetical protein